MSVLILLILLQKKKTFWGSNLNCWLDETKLEPIDDYIKWLLVTCANATNGYAGTQGGLSAEGSARKAKLVVTLRPNVLELSPNCVELPAPTAGPSRAFPTVLAGLVWLRNVYVAMPIPIPGLMSDMDVSDMTRFPKDNSLLRCLCLVFSLLATSGLCVACVRRWPHSRRQCNRTYEKRNVC